MESMDVNAEHFSLQLVGPDSGPVWQQDITLEGKVMHFHWTLITP